MTRVSSSSRVADPPAQIRPFMRARSYTGTRAGPLVREDEHENREEPGGRDEEAHDTTFPHTCSEAVSSALSLGKGAVWVAIQEPA